MKITRLCALVAIVALIAGCVNVPSQDAARIRAAYHSYLSIAKGTPHAQVVALLGKESRHESDGSYYWETRFDSLNYSSIKVRFDSGDRVLDTNVTRGWGVQDPDSQDHIPAEHPN